MSNARLKSIAVERFKSHDKLVTVKTEGLTVLVGRNNSGKSSIVQALLLLKQTLESPRTDVPLHLSGMVSAQSIRELTFGWPSGEEIVGPTFKLAWSSTVDTAAAIERFGNDSVETMVVRKDLEWLAGFDKKKQLDTVTEISLEFGENNGGLVLSRITLASLDANNCRLLEMAFKLADSGDYECIWNGEAANKLVVDLDHFIPYVSLDKRNIGPRNSQRSMLNAFNVLFLQPLDDLKELVKSFNFLSSARSLPPLFYPLSSVAPDGVGVSGETAAEYLHANRNEDIFYHAPNDLVGGGNSSLRREPLESAINNVLRQLGIEDPLKIDEYGNLGFRLLFGRASIQHVGRGLTYLLPIVELGLIGDPSLRVRLKNKNKQSVNDDNTAFDIANSTICAFEEPEAHLHPRIQSKLAEWFVALAMSKRQVFVETHSDHLVRRLRLLVAEAKSGSQLEAWLTKQVSVVQVEQKDGVSSVAVSKLGGKGDLEVWPSDFMDKAAVVEEEIYFASLSKKEGVPANNGGKVIHMDADEP